MPFLIFCFISFCIFPTNSEDHFAQTDIIELPVGRFPEPDCRYSVHHKDKFGGLVKKKVNIGDEIYHFWNCDQNSGRKNYLFCVLVNNCTVSDSENGGERNIKIIDDNGCSLFPNILPDITYENDLSAGIKVHAFSLDVDTTAVHFTCNIRMVFKDNDICQRPTCPKLPKRYSRYYNK